MANGVTPDHFDVVVVGAGSGGLTAAKTSARFGAKVLLLEQLPRLGGDCTWVGCVPSKALIRCAHACHEARCAARFGVKGIATEVSCDWHMVKQHIKSCQEKIYKQDDSPEVLEAAGVQVRLGCHASFLDAHRMQLTGESGSSVVTAEKFILCTGAGPALPALKGLDAVPFFTYETIFDLDELPSSLAIIGGGPIGSELAQAMARLGSQEAADEAEFLLYLSVRGIDVKNVKLFFYMLGSMREDNVIDLKSLVKACVRMKGFATSIDLQSVSFEAKLMHGQVKEMLEAISKRIDKLEVFPFRDVERPQAVAKSSGLAGLASLKEYPIEHASL